MQAFNDNAAYDLTRTAPARLATLRAYARRPGWVRPMDWRAARFANLRTKRGLCHGLGDNGQCWSTFDAGTFTRQEWADEIEGAGVRHSGWFMDAECCDTVRGVVVALPRGRFLSGYHMTQNGEFVYMPAIYESAREAAQQADHAARLAADEAQEYAHRVQQADNISTELAGLRRRLAELRTLCQFAPRAKTYRTEARAVLLMIRDRRDTLKRDFSDVC